MKANFIQKLYESEIKSTELALATESLGDEIQSMIEKANNLKIKDIAELTKRIKYEGEVEKGESFNNEMTQILDSIIQSLTDAKAKIDNNVVQLFQGDDLQNGSENVDMGDFEEDFGADDFEEFSADEDMGDEEVDLGDLDFGEVDREKK